MIANILIFATNLILIATLIASQIQTIESRQRVELSVGEQVEQVVQPKQELIPASFSIQKPFAGDYQLNQSYGPGHYGVDWGTHYYTDILACDDGVVSSISENELYGHHIWVSHAWGSSLYAHLHTWDYVSAGQSVKRGQSLGQSGDTGDSFCPSGERCPHLHFGVQVGGVWVDPMDYTE